MGVKSKDRGVEIPTESLFRWPVVVVFGHIAPCQSLSCMSVSLSHLKGDRNEKNIRGLINRNGKRK